jgi:hypothetical protein
MLLLEEQSDNAVIGYYDSSNVIASKYIPSEKKLAVIFAKGHQYVYENVLPYHYQRFKLAPSQGKSLTEHIINNYAGTKAQLKLSEDLLSQIKEKIQALKNQSKLG